MESPRRALPTMEADLVNFSRSDAMGWMPNGSKRGAERSSSLGFSQFSLKFIGSSLERERDFLDCFTQNWA